MFDSKVNAYDMRRMLQPLWLLGLAVGNVIHSESTKVNPENCMGDKVKQTFFFC